MSSMEQKTALRVEIPMLMGKSRDEAYPFYKEKLGEADEIDEWDGEVDYFRYEGKYRPVQDQKGRWGIDFILHHESEYKVHIDGGSLGLTLKQFSILAKEISDIFGVNKEDVRIVSYSWYNGGEEPITFN